MTLTPESATVNNSLFHTVTTHRLSLSNIYICAAFDHVSDLHGDHTGGDIDALAEAQVDAKYDYSDLLQEPPEEIDDVEAASN